MQIWDLDIPSEQPLARRHRGPVSCVAAGFDAPFGVSCASQDGTVRVWDLRTGLERSRLRPRYRRPETVEVLDDGNRALVGFE